MTKIVPATNYILCLTNTIHQINLKYFIIFVYIENIIMIF